MMKMQMIDLLSVLFFFPFEALVVYFGILDGLGLLVAFTLIKVS